MNTSRDSEFLAWAKSKGLGLDARYPGSAVLTFQPDPDLDRFWVVPREPECRPFFLHFLLGLLGEWKSCHVWRHLGVWRNDSDAADADVRVENQIFRGIGVPMDTANVLEFEQAEWDKLLVLLFTTSVFGWSVGDDVYVVPDHAQQIIKSDHHGVFHVSFRQPGDLERFVDRMHHKGYPLPTEVPDETFKIPSWMKKD